MNIIRLSRKDLSEMIRRAVNSLLNESVSETMGSIVADKEDVIEEIVDYIRNKWEQIRKDGTPPYDKFEFNFKDDPDSGGEVWSYPVIVPEKITEKLGIAENFQLFVLINNFTIGEDKVGILGPADIGTEGSSYGGNDFDKFSKTTMKVKNGRIDLRVPAINGELKTGGLYSTLYHEFNHSFSNLSVKIKNSDGKTDDEISKINLLTQTKRANVNPHFVTQKHLSQDPMANFVQQAFYGSHLKEFKQLNYILYSLWERTERNARAESIYGDLSHMKSTRETFKEDYKKTDVYYVIEHSKELLDGISAVPPDSNMWSYAAIAINMKPRGGKDQSGKAFLKDVKERFISRTEELLDILYKKAMKVAEYYFQKHEPKKEPSRLERYKQEHNK